MTTKAMAAGLLVAVMAACLILVGQTAQAATTFIVNLPGDTRDADLGDDLCDVNLFGSGQQCTLRAAMEQANATLGADVINFDIPDDFGTGVKTINVGSTGNGGLPTVTEQLTINGYTQPGASPNTLASGTNADLLIELNGTDATFADGLEIGDGSSGSLIKGLVINRFGNQGIDVFSLSDTLTNVKIEGNFVGTDPSGMEALGNRGDGIEMDASNSVVGGSTPAKRNLISGNQVDGLSVSVAKDVRVEGNLVGTKADGVGALGNLFNGVDVCCSVSVSILRNSISSNGQLGIDLDVDGRTLNDGDDPSTPQVDPDSDTGANNLQNFPVLTSAKNTSTATTITAKLNSTPGKTYRVQFFSNPSGGDEGKKFIGQKTVTTDASGNVSFTFQPANKVTAGKTVTATATKTSTGDTSEFSAPRTVALSTGSALSPETTKLSGPSGTTKSPTAHFKFTSSDPEATFECSLDGGAYYECSSPENINRLSEGRHVFLVRTVDAEGTADPTPAEWVWTVERNK